MEIAGDVLARGPKARAAQRYWLSRFCARPHAVQGFTPVQTYPDGTAVWVLTDAGWERGVVTGFDRIGGRHHVVFVDQPGRSVYAGHNRLLTRYARELAPGVMRPEGPDAA